MNIPLYTLAALLVLITARTWLPWRIPVWLMMLAAAVIVLITQSISLVNAYNAIDFNIILYLFCMFVLGGALEKSGLLAAITTHCINYFSRTSALILMLIIFAGLSSALLMNDTVAIILTPVMILLSQKTRIPLTPLLLMLAYSVTIGSTLSPVGNPQNLLIAMHAGIAHSLWVFLKYLFIPTLINLGLCFLWCYGVCQKRLPKRIINHHIHTHDAYDPHLQKRAKVSLSLLIALMLCKLALSFVETHTQISYEWIAIISVIPFLFAKQPLSLVRHIDWGTLVFFMAMFVFMQAIWNTGSLQHIIQSAHVSITHPASIFSISIIGSQLISNVPLVALYLPLLKSAGAHNVSFMMLAAGATLAGNFLILGAASNIIVLANAEKRAGQGFSAWQFMTLGIPLGLMNLAVYFGYFTWLR
jgi:Na+/H+ antiporter NhaD/arsenite permease-like protein